ncbi:HPr kinase/phosphorylase [Sphingomonas aracearum]|uniref:Aldolase n=1 Tax=Sphingomonas aracearum TaxID=2283317 RepID=A0A369VU12_9SPHN|nr:aldolase [Sphingomonas aracearum]RDE05135.1 aldolase [Sphingomonas aracearum]
MSEGVEEVRHATTVAIGGKGVAIEGASGTGKSDLALRLIDRGATLVSDDYTLFRRDGAVVRARAPGNIAGKMEIRGLGIHDMPHLPEAPVALVVRLGAAVPRLPEPQISRIAGVELPAVDLAGLEASAPIKVERALAAVLGT